MEIVSFVTTLCAHYPLMLKIKYENDNLLFKPDTIAKQVELEGARFSVKLLNTVMILCAYYKYKKFS